MDENALRAIRHAAETFSAEHILKNTAVSAGEPVLVQEHGGPRRHWRVPLLRTNEQKPFAWVDVQVDHGQQKVVRHGMREEQPAYTVEMSREDIMQALKGHLGPDVTLLNDPTLVFLQVPTKIAWECRVRRPGSEQAEVFVTPDSVQTTPGPPPGFE